MSEPGPFVVVLGIAQDGGYPQAGCSGPCCARAWAEPSLRRRVACLGIADPRTRRAWIIDATPDFPAQLHTLLDAADRESQRIGRAPGAHGGRNLSGVFLTHGHMGHIAGLLHLGREAMATNALQVHCMPRLRSLVQGNEPWAGLVRCGHVDLRLLAPGRTVRLAHDLTVRAVSVPHRDELTETVGFVVRGPGRRVAYVPDVDAWGSPRSALARALGAVDTAYVDGTFYDVGELPGRNMSEVPHPTMSTTIDWLRSWPAQRRPHVRFIHLNHTNPALDVAGPEAKAIAASGLAVAAEGEIVRL